MNYTIITKAARYAGKALLSVLLVITLAGTMFSAPTPKQAEAQFGGQIVYDAANFIKNTLSAVYDQLGAAAQQALVMKEYTLDPIVKDIARRVLQQQTAALVNWINTGFNGNPMFITNLDQHLINALDQVAGNFLTSNGLGFLCQPSRANVQFVLALEYQRKRDFGAASQCTLSGAVDNITGFVGGNFQTGGGWERWFQTVMRPENNIYGQYAIAEQNLNRQLSAKLEQELEEARWGNGMLSVKNCSTGTCITVTPGNVLSEQLNKALGAGQDTLIQADEINEIFGALFNQLSIQALSGVNGLLGLSQASGGGGGQSYLEQLYEEPVNPGGSAGFLENAISSEETYLEMNLSVIEELEAFADEAAASSCDGADELADEAIEIAAEVDADIESSNFNLATLEEMADRYANSADQADKLAVIGEFEELKASGVLHDAGDVAVRQAELAEIMTNLERLQEELDNCN